MKNFKTFLFEQRNIKSIYVQVEGAIWKFSPKEWLNIAEQALKDNGALDITDKSPLKRRPANIKKEPDGSIWSAQNDMMAINPSKFDVDDWERHIENLKEMVKR